MRGVVPIIVLLVGGVAVGLAQSSQGIQWQKDPQQAVALAQRTKLPLMFYVLPGSSDRDERLERAQRRALADPRVLRLSQRFIPVRLSRSRHRDLLEKVHLRRTASMEMSFVAPNGDRLDNISAGGIAEPDSLAQKMARVFNFYRQRLFDTEQRPVLEKKESKPAEIRAALERIRDFIILGADSTVVTLMEREGLDAKNAALCYDVLAQLSTQISVNKLLDLSLDGDANAAKALTKCTPAAAELMLGQMITEDGGVRVDIYKAVTKICRIKKVKSNQWWERAKERLHIKERERVTELVGQAARQWKRENEEYR